MFNRLLGKYKKNGEIRRKRKGYVGCQVVTIQLTGMDDIPLIKMSIENGNIIILSISSIRFPRLVEVKRVVQNLNAFIRKHGGDIAQLGRDFIIIVPPGIELAVRKDMQRKRQEKDIISLEKGSKMEGETSKIFHSKIDQIVKDPIFGFKGETY
ncbi:MAG: cell division protein SepF [Candidatus Heimdallarchaeota archaeon]